MLNRSEGTKLHFVGIGGIGMSGIAEVLCNQGYQVTGSDAAASESTTHLQKQGIRVFIGHHADQVHGANVVVISSAIRSDNPEVLEARRLRIPVIPRAEMLGELMRGKIGIAVAGSHGKTSTTSMIASILTEAGVDPTVIIGGRVNAFGGSNAKLGAGRYVVAEADESDGSFLHLPATFSVVTNIDNDHMDHYQSLENIEHAFLEFVAKLPFYGAAAVCGEDPGIKRCLSRFTKPIVTYGFSEEWDLIAKNITSTDKGSRFQVFYREQGADAQHQLLGTLELNVPGKHSVLNALAATLIALEIDLPFAVVAQALGKFEGVQRRFETVWQDQNRNLRVIDDYGHHPTEIAATLSAAREQWKGRIICIFQPHRYSRTLHCRDGFLSSFREADVVWLTDIYAAGEEPIEGVSAESLVSQIQALALKNQTVAYVGSLEGAFTHAAKSVVPGDLVICMGAGSITRLPRRIAEELGKR